MMLRQLVLPLVLLTSLWPGALQEEEPPTDSGLLCNIQPSVHTEPEGKGTHISISLIVTCS